MCVLIRQRQEPEIVCSLCVFQLEAYDMMVRELGFEMKAQPSEKLKTPEELVREEREKLQKLEVHHGA